MPGEDKSFTFWRLRSHFFIVLSVPAFQGKIICLRGMPMENTHSLSLLLHSVELRCCSDINSPMRIESVEYYLILGIRMNTCFTGSFFLSYHCVSNIALVVFTSNYMLVMYRHWWALRIFFFGHIHSHLFPGMPKRCAGYGRGRKLVAFLAWS